MEQELISNGLSAFIEDNYQTAISYFSKALEKNESNEKALLYRASAHNKIGEYGLALKDLSQIKTDSFDVVYQRALANFYSENFEEARKDLHKARDSYSLSDSESKNLNIILSKLDK
jgi:tetratricopeptide (TPR) repeat protein